MKEKNLLIKEAVKFSEPIDFNFISKLMDRNNFESSLSSNWMNLYILNSVFKINGIQKDPFFEELYHKLDKEYNKEKLQSDLFIFMSMKIGGVSITHKDNYDVIIIGGLGKTLYIVENEEYYVMPGDILRIPKNYTHTAIGLTPRIIFSYGKYNN
jgi:hypothetical protein